MSVTSIAQAIYGAVLATLSHETSGFNPLYRAANNARDVALDPIEIDFSVKTHNFLKSQIDPDNVDRASDNRYPLMALWFADAVNINDQKFNKFSGPARVGLDIWLSWASDKVVRNTEEWALMVDDVVIELFNRPTNDVLRTNPVVYGGQILIKHGGIVPGGKSWRQKLAYLLTVEAHREN